MLYFITFLTDRRKTSSLNPSKEINFNPINNRKKNLLYREN